MIPQHIKEQIEAEAKESRRKYVEVERQIGTPTDAAKWVGMGYKDGYTAGAESMYHSITQNPGQYGLAGRWVKMSEKPKKTGSYFIRDAKEGMGIFFWDAELDYWRWSMKGAIIGNSYQFEWLDESTPDTGKP